MADAEDAAFQAGDFTGHPKVRQRRLLTYLVRSLPSLILVVGLAVTWLAWLDWQRQQTDILREDFRMQVGKVRTGIENLIQTNEQILLGVAGLFSVRDDVSRAQFRSYVEALRLRDRYPGIQGVGFARLIGSAERETLVQAIRDEGFPAFRLHPPGEREICTAILYLEPFDWRNQRAFGFDMYSEPVRRAAMARAWTQGQAATSGKVRLLQETEQDVQAGFLIYVPIYRNDLPHGTSDERRANLLGWAYSPLRMKDLIASFLTLNYPELADRIAIAIYDGADLTDDGLMFDSAPEIERSPNAFEDESQIALSGHSWTLRARTPAAFGPLVHRFSAKDAAILGVGGVLSLACSLLAWILIRTHLRVRDALLQTARAHRQLLESQQRLQLIFDTSDVAIFLTDMQGRITQANERMAEMFRCPMGKLIGSNYVAHVHPSERELSREKMREAFSREIAQVKVERRYWRDDGSEFWGHLGGRLIRDADGNSVGLVGVIADISQRKEAEDRITFLAHHDYLTGLPNRALFVERAGQALVMAKRYQRRLGLLFLDLDGFKPINDHYGHQAGDLVLREVARRLLDHIRASDTACRQGGDEFVILVPELPERQHLERLAQGLSEMIGRPYHALGSTLTIRVSIGLAVYPDDGDNVNELMQNADAAMYRAKQSGRRKTEPLAAIEMRPR
jgi:diguanylate cyclase (GGDEF)-like protein/PAS domain S-box-containing protein